MSSPRRGGLGPRPQRLSFEVAPIVLVRGASLSRQATGFRLHLLGNREPVQTLEPGRYLDCFSVGGKGAGKRIWCQEA